MKNLEKNIYGLTAVSGMILGVLGKNKALKVTGFSLAAIGGGLLFRKIYKEERKKTDEECQKVEKVAEKTGVEIEEVLEPDLLAREGDEEVVFGEIILRSLYKNDKIEKEYLNPDPSEDFTKILHISQNVEKNRIKVGIFLPYRTKYGLSARDVREYFDDLFKEFIDKHQLSMPRDEKTGYPFSTQTGYVVGRDPDDGELYHTQISYIEKDGEKEKFDAYRRRVESVINKWNDKDKETREKYKYVNEFETVRFEQYLELEFPVFPEIATDKEGKRKRGLDLVLATELIVDFLMNVTHEIPCRNTGKEVDFEFDQIMFHPEDDYSIYLYMEDGKVVTNAL